MLNNELHAADAKQASPVSILNIGLFEGIALLTDRPRSYFRLVFQNHFSKEIAATSLHAVAYDYTVAARQAEAFGYPAFAAACSGRMVAG